VLALDKDACLDALIESVLPGFVSLSEGWYERSRTNPAVLLVRYEDLVADPVAEVERVLRFYEVDRPRPATRVAVDATQARSGALKFRRGQAGGWRDELSPSQADRSTQISQSFLSAAGYL
jgi:hypothetical protein